VSGLEGRPNEQPARRGLPSPALFNLAILLVGSFFIFELFRAWASIPLRPLRSKPLHAMNHQVKTSP
jgi:hypothetical protein